MGLKSVPVEVLLRRQKTLREYRWSSYPVYAGWDPEPEWLMTARLKKNKQMEKVAEEVANCLFGQT
jgi:hypothetical protein